MWVLVVLSSVAVLTMMVSYQLFADQNGPNDDKFNAQCTHAQTCTPHYTLAIGYRLGIGWVWLQAHYCIHVCDVFLEIAGYQVLFQQDF